MVITVRMAGSEPKCEIDVERVYRELGQAGRFHVLGLALVALAAVQVGTLHTTYIFLAGDVPYR